MNKMISLLFMLGLAATSCKKENAQPKPVVVSTEGWRVLPNAPQPDNARFDDIFFIDPSTGWVCNNLGQVYNTNDAGKTWKLLSKTDSVWFRCMGFATNQKGWIGNLNLGHEKIDQALWETTDGGYTWTNISSRIQGPHVVGLCGISVINEQVIVAVGRFRGPPIFIKTIDGGQNWKSSDLSAWADQLIDVKFFNENEGVIVGVSGVYASIMPDQFRSVILLTSDGGLTWQQSYLSDQVGEWCWKVHFPTRDVGYATTEGGRQGIVLKTVDGGKSWSRISVGQKVSLEGVGFIDPDRGWVSDVEHGVTFSTSDGGKTWASFIFGHGINRMRVINSQLIFASGSGVSQWTPE